MLHKQATNPIRHLPARHGTERWSNPAIFLASAGPANVLANANKICNFAEFIQGFIVALPLSWTEEENNLSGMNLTILAKTDAEIVSQQTVAGTIQSARAEVQGESLDILKIVLESYRCFAMNPFFLK